MDFFTKTKSEHYYCIQVRISAILLYRFTKHHMLLSSSATHQPNWSVSVLSFGLFLQPPYAQRAFIEKWTSARYKWTSSFWFNKM